MTLVNLQRARDLMTANAFDALVASSTSNVFYLTGFQSMLAILSKTPTCFGVLSSEGDPLLAMPSEDEGYLITSGDSKTGMRRFYGKSHGNASEKPKDEGDPFGLVSEALKDAGAEHGTIGYDGNVMPVSQFDRLRERLPEAIWVDATGVFQRLRMIKSEEEISRMKKSLEILESAYISAFNSLKEGMSEKEFVHEFKEAALSKESDSIFLQLETGFGPRGGLGAGTFPSDYRARKGDVIHFDAGILYNQYCSDLCRVASLGRVSDQARKIYDACLKTQEKVIDMLRPRMKISDIYGVAIETIRAAGFPDYVGAYLGHSIGIEAHEWPSIEEGADISLEENMVMQVEIPFYDSKVGGFNVEDCIHVTSDGPRYLSTLGRHLYEL